MNADNTHEPVLAKGMPRRVVVKSAAWSVPVFATVGVTSAFAGSTRLDVTTRAAGTASNMQLEATRRTPNNEKKIVDFVWSFSAEKTNVVITTITMSTPTTSTGSSPAMSWTAGSTITGDVDQGAFSFTGTNNSASETGVPTFSFTVTVNYTVSGQSAQKLVTVTVTGSTSVTTSTALGVSLS